MDFVVDELSEAVLVDVYPARLPMMDFTVDHGRVGARFYLEAGDSVVVDIVRFKVTLKINNINMKSKPLILFA